MSVDQQILLSHIAAIDVGYAFKSSEFATDGRGVRLLRGDNIAPGSTRWDRTEYWPPNEVVDTRYELRPGDVVLAMDRPWIESGLKFATIRDSDVPAYLVQRVARLRAIGETDQRYLACVIGSKSFSDYILSVQTGTSIPHISSRQIGNFRLKLHTLAEQRAIAEVLGALDDKIAANSMLISSVDQLQHALFRSMLTCALPVPLSDTAEFINGKAFTKGASGTGRVVIRIAELNSGPGGSTVYSDIEVPDEHIARTGDILFAWSGSLTLHRWFRPDGIVNQHIFKVIPRDGYPTWLVYELIRQKLDRFKAIAADKATTMGHIQRKHLDEPVFIPSTSDIGQCGERMEALWQRSLSAETENLMLAATRDALLPQLMSGKLRVKDAEAIVEEVA